MRPYVPECLALDDCLERAKESLRKYRQRQNDAIKASKKISNTNTARI